MAIFTVGLNPAIDRILTCSDFHISGHQQATLAARLAAGKAANVSRALALQSIDSVATGFIGTEELEFFHDQLMSVGPGRILCRFTEVSGVTRENISIVDPKSMQETHLRDRGFAVTAEEIGLLQQRLLHEIRPMDVVVFAGSLCEGVSYDDFTNLIAKCFAKGARIAVDSGGEVLKFACQQDLWLIKPNYEEFCTLLGQEIPNDPTSLSNAAKTLLPHVAQVLISRGASGAVLVTREGCWSGYLPKTLEVVRTVACGDHLLAAVIAGLTNNSPPDKALRNALAIASARAASADYSEYDQALAQELFSEVEITSF